MGNGVCKLLNLLNPTNEENSFVFFVTEISSHYFAFVIIAIVLTGIILGIFLEELYFMHSTPEFRHWLLKDKALVLLALYPVSSLNSASFPLGFGPFEVNIEFRARSTKRRVRHKHQVVCCSAAVSL